MNLKYGLLCIGKYHQEGMGKRVMIFWLRRNPLTILLNVPGGATVRNASSPRPLVAE